MISSWSTYLGGYRPNRQREGHAVRRTRWVGSKAGAEARRQGGKVGRWAREARYLRRQLEVPSSEHNLWPLVGY